MLGRNRHGDYDDKRGYWGPKLNLRIKPKKQILRGEPETLAVLQTFTQVWSMDLLHDDLEAGRAYRLFNVIDDFNRERQGGGTGLPASQQRQHDRILVKQYCTSG